MPANEKYMPNEGLELIDEILRRHSMLEKRIIDLERQTWNADTPPALPRIDPVTYPDPYEGQRAIDVADEQHTWYSDGEWRKAAAGGVAMYEIKVFEDPNVVVVGDGRFYWPIPDDLADSDIVYVDAGVSTPSSSGPVQIQVAHQVNGVGAFTDILTTKVSIAAGDKNATPGVVSGGSWGITDGDWLRIDIDAAGVTSKGLALMLGVTPSPLAAVAIAGAQGPPGGVTAWTGAWNSVTTYTTGQAVSNGGTSYVAIAGSTDVEPGVDAGWQTYWMVLAGAQQVTILGYVMDGSGVALDVGIKGAGLPIYFNCTIVECTLLADVVGSVVLDIWKDTYGSYPPVDADSITASSPMTLTSAMKTTNTALTGWNTSIAAGDVLRFNIDSVSIITSLTVGFKLLRT